MKGKSHINVPEGYFETLQERLSAIPGQSRVSAGKRIAPYITLAASFLTAVAAGTFILQKTASKDSLSNEEIVSYLIASGTSVEHLEYLRYEEDD